MAMDWIVSVKDLLRMQERQAPSHPGASSSSPNAGAGTTATATQTSSAIATSTTTAISNTKATPASALP